MGQVDRLKREDLPRLSALCRGGAAPLADVLRNSVGFKKDTNYLQLVNYAEAMVLWNIAWYDEQLIYVQLFLEIR